METADQIRALASAGHSRTDAARILGIERRKFYDICKLLPEITWPAKNQSLSARAGYRKRDETMRKHHATR